MNNLKKIHIFLLFGLFILLNACRGQVSPKTGVDKPLGKLVASLDDRIWDVFQDSRNRYWFGSNGRGLYLYDGTDLRQFTMKDGLIDNTIRGIKEDHLGRIFIETPEGVSRYDGDRFENLEIVSSPKNKWQLEPNDLWFNCNGSPNDVYRYDGERLLELRLPRKDIDKLFDINTRGMGFNPYSVFGLQKDKIGNLWIGTMMAGAYRFDGHSFLWFGEKELSQLEGGRVPGVRSMVQDKDGYFWLSNLLHKYKLTSDSTYEKIEGANHEDLQPHLGLPYFNSSISDSEGNLWLVKYSNRLMQYEGLKLSEFVLERDGPEVLFMSIIQDHNGLFWLGTDNAGVYTYDGTSFKKFLPVGS